ncbi:hypothetical protein HYFRA_00006025 [Hymenoscyphus fraxineus]|uniref:Uncharacterized protein n=1 Tax=Hymenoscyphus fraxineus TaxID=746836 RepID=A0A9N9PTD4_9HELO|nr:hypothetical protein HYFRA_00006025 [Hymenoscyphus fraxineus]
MLSKLCCTGAGAARVHGEDETFLPARIIAKATRPSMRSSNPQRRNKKGDLVHPDRFVVTPYHDNVYNTNYMWADAVASSRNSRSSSDERLRQS